MPLALLRPPSALGVVVAARPIFPRVAAIAVLIAVLALGLWLRFTDLSQPPLWYDEQSSLLGATGQTISKETSLPDIPGLRTGFSPATVWAKNQLGNVVRATDSFDRSNGLLYNFVLHYWIALAGLEDAALKSLSVLIGTLTLATIFLGLRKVGVGLPGAAAASLFAALHPLLIWSSREVRSYALATLLAVTATFLLLHLVRSCEEERPVVKVAGLYVLAAIGALLSHYLTFSILAGHGLWALLTVRNKRAWKMMILAGATIVGMFVLWLTTAGANGVKEMAVSSQAWAERARLQEFSWLQTATLERVREGFFTDFVTYVLLQPKQYYELAFVHLPSVLEMGAVTFGWTLFFVALLALAGTGVWSARRDASIGERIQVLMLILAVMAPLWAVVLAWRSGHTLSFAQRYMTFSAPFAAIFLGLCAYSLVNRTAWKRPLLAAKLPLQALLCGMAVAYLCNPDRIAQSHLDPRGNLFLKAANDIAAIARPGDIVVYAVPFDAIMLSLYLKRRPDVDSILEDQGVPNRPAVMIRRGSSEIPIVDKLELR